MITRSIYIFLLEETKAKFEKFRVGISQYEQYNICKFKNFFVYAHTHIQQCVSECYKIALM